MVDGAHRGTAAGSDHYVAAVAEGEQHARFEGAEHLLAGASEQLGNRHARLLFDQRIDVDEPVGDRAGQQPPHGALARAHEPHQRDSIRQRHPIPEPAGRG